MEDFIKDQIRYTLQYLPFHLGASYAKKLSSPEVEAVRRKTGGFIKGICHPTENFDQIKGAGIQWARPDIPVPFDKEGNLRQGYIDWKEKWGRFHDNGIRLLAVTPYPYEFINDMGLDPRLPENEARLQEVAVFLVNDLKDIVSGFQITNEMGIPRFIKPLTMKEAIRFIGLQLEAMYPHKGDLLLGYNSAGPQCDLHRGLRPWHQYCDYVGIDIYVGSFTPAGNWMWIHEAALRYLWSMTGKPILLTEFGYISGGAPKTPEEKKAILERYGVSSEEEAREKIDFVMENIAKVNPKMHEYIVKNASGGYADFLFQLDFCNHFYSELPATTVIKAYPHTPAGQAGFYRDIFPRFSKLPFLIGAFIYCYQDSAKCYVCDQADCPTETRWGIVDMDGKEKPSYYAVRDALAQVK